MHMLSFKLMYFCLSLLFFCIKAF